MRKNIIELASNKTIILYLAYLGAVLILGIFLAEFYCRIVGVCRLSSFRLRDYPNNEIYTTSYFLPSELSPNIAGFSNSLGMRDKEYKINKPPGVFRIIVLGDSITMFGKYTDYLEELLNKGSSVEREVWNCAIGGHNLKDYYYNLRYRSIKYDPDLLIIGLCLNDGHLSPVMFRTTDGRMHCYRPFKLLKGEFDNWFYCHSDLYRLILSNIETKFIKQNPIDSESLARIYLSKIMNITKTHKIPLLLVIFPHLSPDSENTNEYKAIKGVVNELGIEHIDLHEVFKPQERHLYLDKAEDIIHPNDNAHRIAAGVIAQYLTANNKLKNN